MLSVNWFFGGSNPFKPPNRFRSLSISKQVRKIEIVTRKPNTVEIWLAVREDGSWIAYGDSTKSPEATMNTLVGNSKVKYHQRVIKLPVPHKKQELPEVPNIRIAASDVKIGDMLHAQRSHWFEVTRIERCDDIVKFNWGRKNVRFDTKIEVAIPRPVEIC